jgi:stage III sporulation protein AB
MWMKCLGALLVSAAAAALGWLLAAGLEKRAAQLRELRQLLQRLETEIVYAASPLPQALRQAAGERPGCAEIFRLAAELLQAGRGLTAAEAWRQAIGQTAECLSLSAADRALLLRFGEGIGLSDISDQKKRLALLREELTMALAEAERERALYARVWRTLGFTSGALLALFLL